MEHVPVVLQVAIIVLLILHMRSERKWRKMMLESFDELDRQQRDLNERMSDGKTANVSVPDVRSH